jgi:hypothetical protein
MGESAAKYRTELDLDEFERRLRASAPSQQARPSAASAPDPLAELARLVSGAGERRQDPFEALFRAQRAVTEGAPPPLQSPREPYMPAPAAHQPAQSPPEPEPHWAEEPARLDSPWAAQAPEFAPEPQAFAPQPAQPGNRRRIVYVMSALLVGGVALFAGGLAFKKGSSGLPQVIQADSDPVRVKPPSQDAAANSVGQALFDGKNDSAPAKVASKTEQPADLAVAARQAEAKAASAAAVATPMPPQPMPSQSMPSQSMPSQSMSSQPASAAPQPADEAGLMAPRKVKTISIRADGSLLNAPAAQRPRSTLPTLAAGGPEAAAVAPVARPETPRAAAAVEAPPKRRARHEVKPEAKPDAVAAISEPAASGGYAVQLASEPAEVAARAAATRFVVKYGSALKGRAPTFAPAKVGEKTIYRVRVGHLSKQAAHGMCDAIKQQGGACFIVRD